MQNISSNLYYTTTHFSDHKFCVSRPVSQVCFMPHVHIIQKQKFHAQAWPKRHPSDMTRQTYEPGTRLPFGYVVLGVSSPNRSLLQCTDGHPLCSTTKRFKPSRRLERAQNAQTNGRTMPRDRPEGPVWHIWGHGRDRSTWGGSPMYPRTSQHVF